ncbi:Tad domain-containing protein [Novosphingobium sp.]|uniref:Tad domain-containing protein n=1 Tax=Novosphingobium sp. TaxID=1874826 RepID=UPI0025FE9739|nr:Tad domain-containing protein [Novosphingobium sp.]
MNGLPPETRHRLASKDSSPRNLRLLPQSIRAAFGSLSRDRSGNVIALVAAAIIPLIALVGSSIDLGRGYLAQSRLQSACDAGALAARRQMESYANFNPATQSAPVVARGKVLFDNNFPDGQYGSINRSFTVVIQNDLAILATASIRLPTTMMQIFGITGIPLTTTCAAKLNFNNTDVMMVLDTTGSMADTNPGDPAPKIDELRSVVMSFYNQLEAAKTAGTRIRYGFLPYSTNVNVGFLLKSDWMVDNWTYQSRVPVDLGTTYTAYVGNWTYTKISGSMTPITSYDSPTCPSDTVIYNQTYANQSNAGTVTEDDIYRTVATGNAYNCAPVSEGSFTVTGFTYSNYLYESEYKVTGQHTFKNYAWNYKPVSYLVSGIKGSMGSSPIAGGSINAPVFWDSDLRAPATYPVNFAGCIEERDTTEISDYSNVDLNQALDLDIDRVPTPGDPRTQWRPIFEQIDFDRAMNWDGSGAFSTSPTQVDADFVNPTWGGFSACPAPARKLDTIDQASLQSYLNTLNPNGSTYHDIGMIWGGRLLSPTGLFAAENSDLPDGPTNRNLIFLTDGMTSTLDLSYGTYGVEPLDQRRWSSASPLTLNQVVENRFTLACNEVKKRNITVWVIGFGTTLNPVLTSCAGVGHAYSAQNASQLTAAFSSIASQLGNLRISK